MKYILLTILLIFGATTVSASSLTNILRYGTYPNQTCGFIISGEINSDTVSGFKKVLKSIRNPQDCSLNSSGKPAYTFFKTVTLTGSNGGDLNAAVEIIDLIIKNDLITHIDELITDERQCLSSCALIFASGSQRHYTNPRALNSASTNNILGIHKPYFTEGNYDYLNNEKVLDEIKYSLIKIFNENDIDPRFTIKMFETPSESILFPKVTDLLIWGVITSFSLPEFYKSAELQDSNCKSKMSYLKNVNAAFELKFNYLKKEPVLSSNSDRIYSPSEIKKGYQKSLSCLNYHFLH